MKIRKKGSNTRSIFVILFILLIFGNCIDQTPENDTEFHSRTSPKSYHVSIGVTVENTGKILEKLVIVLPLAQTNTYQDIKNVKLNGGEILTIPETDDKYVRFTITGSDLPSAGQTKKWGYEFDVTLYTITTDLDHIETIYPYDVNSTTYTWYTGASGEYVDPYNSTIESIGDNIWKESSDLLDYSKRCYLYVAKNFQYLNPGTGLHPLSELLANGGGDCGNLNSIYISLLRYKGIPSRHLVTVRPDGSGHVWTDFYLENYGWVPVDVTSKKYASLFGDYFGKIDIGKTGIILSKEVYLPLQIEDNNVQYAPILQYYSWWHWDSGGYGNVLVGNYITSIEI
ncbi:MAG: hypothetical protein AYK18_14770 [Theionarchaea archaeon DG-70]|nr:MAG: hypothetical protein AYK18_14770 [Theionarchaea archaeon DG-70]